MNGRSQQKHYRSCLLISKLKNHPASSGCLYKSGFTPIKPKNVLTLVTSASVLRPMKKFHCLNRVPNIMFNTYEQHLMTFTLNPHRFLMESLCNVYVIAFYFYPPSSYIQNKIKSYPRASVFSRRQLRTILHSQTSPWLNSWVFH